MTSSLEQKDAVQRVKDAAQITDIVGECVSLKRAGVNMKGLCPFHAEKTPSFIVNPARQTFHCFGCGEGGDVFTFMEKYYSLTFYEALKQLAQRYQITLPERPTNGLPTCTTSTSRTMAARRRHGPTSTKGAFPRR